MGCYRPRRAGSLGTLRTVTWTWRARRLLAFHGHHNLLLSLQVNRCCCQQNLLRTIGSHVYKFVNPRSHMRMLHSRILNLLLLLGSDFINRLQRSSQNGGLNGGTVSNYVEINIGTLRQERSNVGETRPYNGTRVSIEISIWIHRHIGSWTIAQAILMMMHRKMGRNVGRYHIGNENVPSICTDSKCLHNMCGNRLTYHYVYIRLWNGMLLRRWMLDLTHLGVIPCASQRARVDIRKIYESVCHVGRNQ